MENTIQKPTLGEVVAAKIMYLPNEGLIFNAQRFGPMNFEGLRQANYGFGFRMATMPELVPLVYTSLENQTYESAKNVINALRNHWLTGNTGILYVPKGMFVQDNPALENGRISMNQETLEDRLGSYQERGVFFSDDRKIRFVPYGFKRESQKASVLSENPGIIALTGSEKNAEKLARASDCYRANPSLWTLDKTNSPEIRVASLYSDSDDIDGGLNICASHSENCGNRFSFGIWDKETEFHFLGDDPAKKQLVF